MPLDEFASHHLCKVLRMAEGRPLILFDGSGGEYEAIIERANARQAEVRLQAHLPGVADSPLRIHLALALSRADRFDWALQKATELGVSSVQPLITGRSEKWSASRADKKTGHWQRLLTSAAEQCARCSVPDLLPPAALADWQPPQNHLRLVLQPGGQPLRPGDMLQNKPESVILVVGPEGGFEPSELNLLNSSLGFRATGVGPRVLRTETAPLAVISLLQFVWGDLS